MEKFGSAELTVQKKSNRRDIRNIATMEIYQIIVRVGWIFKTETIIMPAVLDAVVDSGLMRGMLPVMNRGGQSVPPLMYAPHLAKQPIKKWALVRTSVAMSACFAVLAVTWAPLAASRPDLLALLFLLLYGLFAAANGLNLLVVASLQGKLVSPLHRGRAMVVSVAIGSVLAIVMALLFLGPWLHDPVTGFPKIFGITAVLFGIAAVVPAFFDEPADQEVDTLVERSPHTTEAVAEKATWIPKKLCGFQSRTRAAVNEWRTTLQKDRGLRKVCVVAAMFSAVLMLFPHYQALARDRLGTTLQSLLTWVVVQNASTGIASLVVGPLTDRRGTRDVLAWLVIGSSFTPLLATVLAQLPHEIAGELFWIVYVPLGLNPITLKIFTNYALELAPSKSEHPRYVSIVGAAIALPFVLSPLIGVLVDVVGFQQMFVAGTLVIATGGILAFGLPEPRNQLNALQNMTFSRK